MYIYDTMIITDLVEELEEAEDDLDLAEEYVTRITDAPSLAELQGQEGQQGSAKQ